MPLQNRVDPSELEELADWLGVAITLISKHSQVLVYMVRGSKSTSESDQILLSLALISGANQPNSDQTISSAGKSWDFRNSNDS